MPYEIDFLRAGNSNGDAIVVKWGETKDSDFYLNLIDGGFTDTGDQIIDHVKRYYSTTAIFANVVLTHADNDHACGLIKVLECEDFTIHTLWMNRPWDYVDEVLDKFHGLYTREGLIKKMREMHPYLVEMEKIAERRGIQIRAPLQGAQIGAFTVLAPSRDRYVQLIPDLDKTPQSYAADSTAGIGNILIKALGSVVEKIKETLDIETLDENPPATSASNETSVVQWAILDDRRVLLTGDVGPDGLNEAADYLENISLETQPTLVQIPHQGRRRNVKPSVLNRWLGSYPAEGRGHALASVGKDQDKYPRKKVANAFTRRGFKVYATHNSWVNFVGGYDRRPGCSTLDPIPLSPDVED